jgi:hypothetical protein
MYRKVLVGGVTAAAIVGAGGTALALTGSGSTSAGRGTVTSTAISGRAGLPGAGRLLKRLSHAQIVVHTRKGFVTHDLIRGTVTDVSPSSITVKAADKTSETFVVNSATKVRVRSNGHGARASISAVHDGDDVLVAGTGSSIYTAKHVIDIKK